MIKHPAWIEIDLKRFEENISNIKWYIGNTLLCLPIKANAYGHGLIPIAKAAQKAGVDYLAVSCLQEGSLLRSSGITLPIIIFGPVYEDQICNLIDLDLEFTISSKYKADLAQSICEKKKKKAKVHLKIDTGMRRIGVRISSAFSLYEYLQKSDLIEIKGIYSHLATADTENDVFAKKQIEDFANFSNFIKGKKPVFHLANSGGVVYYPNSYFDMVRPGLLSFGYFSNPHVLVKPFFSLKAKVGYFKVIEKGESVGYSQSYIAPKRTRIVTIPIGYGDGYRRSLSNIGSVLIRGKTYPICGNICMDQFMVDIGDDEAYVGDEVVLIGSQGDKEITLQQVADLCKTIPYEVLCLFNERVPRVYKHNCKYSLVE